MVEAAWTPVQFKTWRARMRLTQKEAARELGLSLPTVKNYETGLRRNRDPDGQRIAAPIPLHIALACLALEAGLKAI
jgi:transcriptional regulator with XRE-family HTH domain